MGLWDASWWGLLLKCTDDGRRGRVERAESAPVNIELAEAVAVPTHPSFRRRFHAWNHHLQILDVAPLQHSGPLMEAQVTMGVPALIWVFRTRASSGGRARVNCARGHGQGWCQ